MNYPIICLSKGRASEKLAKTLVLFSNASRELRDRFRVLIEPQDSPAYRAAFPKLNFEILPKDNPGLPKARQYALDLFRRLGTPFWMLDDDVSGFGRSLGSSIHKITPDEAFTAADKLLVMCQNLIEPKLGVLGQAALEYEQFAWSSMKDVKWRGYCDVAVWLNAPAIADHCAYRDEMALKEDRDFTLQVLAMGMETARLSRLSFKAPKNGSNEGGLKPMYGSSGREELAVDRMIAAWPGVVSKQLKTDGRIDCKIDWWAAYRKWLGANT